MVTMYPSYNAECRNMILYFLTKHFPDPDHLVVPITPLKTHTDIEAMERICAYVPSFFLFKYFRYGKKYTAFLHIAKLVVDRRAEHPHRRRQPLKTHTDIEAMERMFTGTSFKEDYKILNKAIREYGYNIPPLVNAYMSLKLHDVRQILLYEPRREVKHMTRGYAWLAVGSKSDIVTRGGRQASEEARRVKRIVYNLKTK